MNVNDAEERDRATTRVALGALAQRAPVLIQFVKFGLVGVSNTLITFAVYTLLLKVFGVWYLAASAIGFVVGAVNGFLLNRRWTFREHVGDSLTPVRWGVVQGCGLALNEALLYLFVHDASLDKLASQAFATVIVTVTTFFANRAWTFRAHPSHVDGEPRNETSETILAPEGPT
jgi:putative flippase GtrA